jgi:sugar lactone lactonase YvrE
MWQMLGIPQHASARRPLLVLLPVVLALAAAPPAPVAALVTTDDVISTIAGSTAGFSGDGGPARQARLDQPRDTDVADDGTIYLTDTYNHRIRRIAPDGTITTVAGNGSAAYNGDDRPAVEASLKWPHDVTVDERGILYIADSAHHRIRKVGMGGRISTVAGTGVAGSTGDGGQATSAQIRNPKSVALYGDFLFFTSLEHKVRRVNLTTGVIRTVAGRGTAGYSGDGGQATAAQLNSPQRMDIDSQGNLYIADSDNNVVRRVDASTGVIRTIAGRGERGSSGDGGPATDARLNRPRGLALQGDNVLYVADSNNHRVRRVDLQAHTIHRVAGTTRGFSGDGGPAGDARLDQPRGLTLLSGGRLLVADTFNNRLRVIDPQG